MQPLPEQGQRERKLKKKNYIKIMLCFSSLCWKKDVERVNIPNYYLSSIHRQ